MPPGASKEALFQFHPRTVGKVQEVVQFDVNGLSTTNVRFAGEGTALKVLASLSALMLVVYSDL